VAEDPLERQGLGKVGLRLTGEIGDVKCRAVDDGPPDHRRATHPEATCVIDRHLRHELAGGGHRAQAVALHEDHPPVVDAAEPYGAGDDCVEHGLGVGRRTRDDIQDLAGGRLLFLRLNQLAIARLELPQRLRLELQCLRQALLKVADLGAFVLRRLTGERCLGVRLTLRALCTATHQPSLPSTAQRSPTG